MKRIDMNLVSCGVGLIESVGENVPTRILLVSDGVVPSRKGDFVLDASGAGEVIRQFDAHGVDLVIDYEHQTLGQEYSAPDGRARAAGWITALSYEPGRGLFGSVRWNDEAVNMIAGFEYRYFSPVVIVRKDDKRMVGLHSVALTNKPAIRHSRPIVALVNTDGIVGEWIMADQPTQGQVPGGGTGGGGAAMPDTVEGLIVELKKQLGIEEGDAVAVLKAALAKLTADAPTTEEAVPEGVVKALAMSAGTKLADVITKIDAIRGGRLAGENSELVALKDKVSNLTEQVTAERKARQSLEADRVVNADTHKGKMSAAEIAYHTDRLKGAEDFEATVADFEKLMGTRPVVLKQDVLAPWTGGSPEGGDREQVINSAAGEYDRDSSCGQTRMTSKSSFVNMRLRDVGHGRLNEEETKRFDRVTH